MNVEETQDQDLLAQYREPNFQELLGELDVSLVVRFFNYFSRFEYALKRRNFKRVSEGFVIGANWPRYVGTLRSIHYPTESVKVKNAIEYLCNHPVGRQLSNLSWQHSRPITPFSFKQALKQVPYIRNNLFHGGKYAESDPARNTELLESAIHLMQYCLINDRQLARYFHRLDI